MTPEAGALRKLSPGLDTTARDSNIDTSAVSVQLL